MMVRLFFLSIAVLLASTSAFIPLPFVQKNAAVRSELGMFDPLIIDATTTASVAADSLSQFMQQSSNLLSFELESLSTMTSNLVDQCSNILAFGDQGKNLAGVFFQASLLPYILFLYFLSFRANRINNIANFGFQFILPFVFATIPSGIITKSVYGSSLADVDWLHGGAELLLTVANILIVSGTLSRESWFERS